MGGMFMAELIVCVTDRSSRRISNHDSSLTLEDVTHLNLDVLPAPLLGNLLSDTLLVHPICRSESSESNVMSEEVNEMFGCRKKGGKRQLRTPNPE